MPKRRPLSNLSKKTRTKKHKKHKRKSNNDNNDNDISPSTSINYSEFIMSISSHKAARKIVKHYCESAIKLAMDENEFEDPMSDQKPHLKLEPITNGPALYLWFDQNGNLKKAGSTSHFADRLKHYEENKENEEFMAGKFVRVLDFDNVSLHFYEKLDENYNAMMNELRTCKELHPCQRSLFEALHCYAGENLGPKKSIMLQMMEFGLQIHYELPAPVEFLMFDEKVIERCVSYMIFVFCLNGHHYNTCLLFPQSL